MARGPWLNTRNERATRCGIADGLVTPSWPLGLAMAWMHFDVYMAQYTPTTSPALLRAVASLPASSSVRLRILMEDFAKGSV